MVFPLVCIFGDSSSQISLKEKGVVFYIKNALRESVKIVRVDGCVFPKGTADLRCDYGFYDKPNQGQDADDLNRPLFLVELKGGGQIEHALDQIGAVITKYNLRKKVSKCYLVYQKNPLSATETQVAGKKFLGSHGVVVKFVKSGFEHVYS